MSEIVKAPNPLRTVVNWIIAGQSEPDVIEAIEATWPKEKSRPLVLRAMKELAKSSDPDPAIIRGFAIEGTRELYRKATEIGDHQTALRALKQLVELTK